MSNNDDLKLNNQNNLKHENASFVSDKIKSKNNKLKLQSLIEKRLAKADAIEEKQKKKSINKKDYVKNENIEKKFDTSVIPSISLNELKKQEEKNNLFQTQVLSKVKNSDKKFSFSIFKKKEKISKPKEEKEYIEKTESLDLFKTAVLENIKIEKERQEKNKKKLIEEKKAIERSKKEEEKKRKQEEIRKKKLEKEKALELKKQKQREKNKKSENKSDNTISEEKKDFVNNLFQLFKSDVDKKKEEQQKEFERRRQELEKTKDLDSYRNEVRKSINEELDKEELINKEKEDAIRRELKLDKKKEPKKSKFKELSEKRKQRLLEKKARQEELKKQNEIMKQELSLKKEAEEKAQKEREELEKKAFEERKALDKERKEQEAEISKQEADRKRIEKEERQKIEKERTLEREKQKQLEKEAEERKKEEQKLLDKEQKEKVGYDKEQERKIKEENKRLEREKKDNEKKEKLRLKLEEQQRVKKLKEEKELERQTQKREREKRLKEEKERALQEKKEKKELIEKIRREDKEKAKSERKSLDEKVKDWYNNLSFVKDAKNRRELQREALLLDVNSPDSQRSTEKIIYKYVARNSENGKEETGYFGAYSKLDVHSFLLAEGYEVYEITPQTGLKGEAGIKKIKLSTNELDFFLTQLSTFLKSGITLVESVKILSKQTNKSTTRNLYKALVYELSMGDNFSEALDKQGTAFPRLLINMVKTAELTGDLPETLDDMASYYRETEDTRKQMIGALTYPAVILVFALTILIYIMVSVIPQFVSIYDSLDSELPTITVIIMNVSNFLQSYWVWLIIGLIAVIAIFIMLYRSIKVFKTVVQSFTMYLPVFGKIIIYNEVTMFTKTFASLLNHSVYITDCMDVLSKITNNEIYKMLIFDTITNLAKGDAISNSFKNHWAFPNIAYEMILTGEKTGQLGSMMDKVSKYYQTQHKNSINQIKAFIEPVMIVMLAVIVGVVLMAVILPMFDMYQNIG